MTAGIYGSSGSSIVIENLADQLGKRGIEVTIGSLKFNRTPPNGAYDVTVLPVYDVSKLRRFLNNFDIVHNHHPIMNYLTFVSQKSFIYHYHGIPSFGRGELYRLSMLASVKTTNRLFDAVIAVSESGATELKRYFNLKNIYTIYNGVDISRFRDELEEKFRKGKPQLLFVGNLYEHKKVEELIVALKELINIYPKAHLQIVGEGYTRKKLERIVLRLDLREHVSFAGFIPHTELPYYYSSCDIYVTASRCELFPLPLIEAWACGKPVVASRVPSHVELLTRSNAGELYNVGDIADLCATITDVYEHEKEYKTSAIGFARHHDWSAVADRVLKLYGLLT